MNFLIGHHNLSLELKQNFEQIITKHALIKSIMYLGSPKNIVYVDTKTEHLLETTFPEWSKEERLRWYNVFYNFNTSLLVEFITIYKQRHDLINKLQLDENLLYQNKHDFEIPVFAKGREIASTSDVKVPPALKSSDDENRKILQQSMCLSLKYISTNLSVSLPEIKGISLLYGAHVSLVDESHNMCMYFFGTQHLGNSIETNVTKILMTIFQDMCQQSFHRVVLNVFLEHNKSFMQHQPLLWHRYTSNDKILDAVLQLTFKIQHLAEFKERIFLHNIDIRQLSFSSFGSRSFYLGDNNDILLLFVIEYYKDILVTLRSYNDILIHKQMERSKRSINFTKTLFGVLEDLFTQLVLPLEDTHKAYLHVIELYDSKDQTCWQSALITFIRLLAKLEDASTFVMDVYAILRAFRTFPRAPSGLKNIMFWTGQQHTKNYLEILVRLSDKKLIKIHNISLVDDTPKLYLLE